MYILSLSSQTFSEYEFEVNNLNFTISLVIISLLFKTILVGKAEIAFN